MGPENRRILIVYNADGGILSAVKDAVHKVVAPASYPCSLCAITYGAVSMRDDWRRFLNTLSDEVTFHHRDDFARDFPSINAPLPAIFHSRNGEPPRVLVSNLELDQIKGLAALIALMRERLALGAEPSAAG